MHRCSNVALRAYDAHRGNRRSGQFCVSHRTCADHPPYRIGTRRYCDRVCRQHRCLSDRRSISRTSVRFRRRDARRSGWSSARVSPGSRAPSRVGLASCNGSAARRGTLVGALHADLWRERSPGESRRRVHAGVRRQHERGVRQFLPAVVAHAWRRVLDSRRRPDSSRARSSSLRDHDHRGRLRCPLERSETHDGRSRMAGFQGGDALVARPGRLSRDDQRRGAHRRGHFARSNGRGHRPLRDILVLERRPNSNPPARAT